MQPTASGRTLRNGSVHQPYVALFQGMNTTWCSILSYPQKIFIYRIIILLIEALQLPSIPLDLWVKCLEVDLLA